MFARTDTLLQLNSLEGLITEGFVCAQIKIFSKLLKQTSKRIENQKKRKYTDVGNNSQLIGALFIQLPCIR